MSFPTGLAIRGIRVLAETSSTFTAAFDSNPPLREWSSILAETQTNGVGQLGRTWISPPGNLYASVRLPNVPPFTGMAAAPVVGALLAEVFNALGVPVLVKWPNDLVLMGDIGDSAVLRKVGGILVQERGGVILAGVGLNLDSAPSDMQLRAQAALPAGILPEDTLRRAGVTCLVGLWQRLVLFMQSKVGPEGIPPALWRDKLFSRLAFRGEMVDVLDKDIIHGRLVGVDDEGGLMLRTIDGEITLYSGSLQVRGEQLE